MALSWVLNDDDRASRLLALTGLEPDHLRAALTEPAIQGAVLEFLAGNEADLLAASEAIGLPPETFVAARDRLAPRTDDMY